MCQHLGGSVGCQEGREALKRGWGRLDGWANVNGSALEVEVGSSVSLVPPASQQERHSDASLERSEAELPVTVPALRREGAIQCVLMLAV